MIRIDFKNALNKAKNKKKLTSDQLSRFIKSQSSAIPELFKKKNQSGYAFISLPEDVALVQKIKKFVEIQKKNRWEGIVVLGIGGSALGGIAAQDALLGSLHNLLKKPRLFFVDNIDPEYLHAILAVTGFEKTLFIVVSKSGGTTEPMALYSIVKEKLAKQFPKNWQERVVFITDPKTGTLRRLGNKEKITMFEIPAEIGGRFSVLTAAGLLPLALAGADIGGILEGAREMTEEIRKKTGVANPALLLASLQYLMDTQCGKTMTVMMPYSNFLFRMGDWYRQLLAESVGKNKKTGPTPINALGSTDQHSQLQLYNEGPENKWFIFLRLKSFRNDFKIQKSVTDEMEFLSGKNLSRILDASYLGTSGSLTKNERPNITLEIDSITPQSIGALFTLLEFQDALLGLFYKVNAFDQPGVEESKKITKQILSRQDSKFEI